VSLVWFVPLFLLASERFAGVELPARVVLLDTQEVLHLRAHVKVEQKYEPFYQLALYADRSLRKSTELLDGWEACQFTLIWYPTELTSAEVRQHFTMRFIRAISNEDYPMLGPSIERIIEQLPGVVRGDTWTIDYWPDRGMWLRIPGQEPIRVQGIQLARSVISAWLGPKSEVQQSLLQPPAEAAK
jgi:hypothetical protein